MVSSEVQRTLVKSPPELWAELSDPASLARHLGELGEIRITRVEPETTVEWAAEDIAGTVSIKPSGWGTKVTLTVSRDAAVVQQEPHDHGSAEPEAQPASEPIAGEANEAAPATQTGPAPVVEAEPVTEAEPAIEPEPANEAAVEPEPKPGFFARLFGRRRRAKPATEPELSSQAELPPQPKPQAPPPDPFVAAREALALEALQGMHLFTPPPPSPRAIARAEAISAELKAAEEVAADEVTAEEVTAVLTAVLDRLGAAHHRPFSRA